MKEVVCLLDGITDAPLHDLGDLTPLQRAHTPALDRMSAEGECLLGLPPDHGGFEAGLLALLGVTEPVALGALEAYSVNYVSREGERAYCLRLVGLGADTVVDVADDLVSDQEGVVLCGALSSHWELPVLHLIGPRAVVVVNIEAVAGLRLSPAAAVGTPWRNLVPKELWSLVDVGNAVLAASEINILKRELGEQPADGIWLFGGGGPCEAVAAVSGVLGARTAATRGAGLLAGWDVQEVPSDPNRIVEWIAGMEAECVMVEVPHVWESTYKGALVEKIKRIEWLDRLLIAPLLDSGAHVTVLSTKHCDIRAGEPVAGAVPIVRFPGEGERRSRFDEVAFSDLKVRPLSKVHLLQHPA